MRDVELGLEGAPEEYEVRLQKLLEHTCDYKWMKYECLSYIE